MGEREEGISNSEGIKLSVSVKSVQIRTPPGSGTLGLAAVLVYGRKTRLALSDCSVRDHADAGMLVCEHAHAVVTSSAWRSTPSRSGRAGVWSCAGRSCAIASRCAPFLWPLLAVFAPERVSLLGLWMCAELCGQTTF